MTMAATIPPEPDLGDQVELAQAPAAKRGLVTPVLRALELLATFTPHDHWLGNKEIADRAGLPVSTVSRFLRTLVSLGYVGYRSDRRQYCLTSSVLSLGYVATSHSDVQRFARPEMLKFACAHNVTVLLAMRDRLHVVALESCMGDGSFRRKGLAVGTRVGIASSRMGYTLLASLPPLERTYLLENLARRMPRDWKGPEPRLSDAVRQIQSTGFYFTPSRLQKDLGTLAVPMSLHESGMFVIACIGSLSSMHKTRITRELGPELVKLASRIRQAVEQSCASI